jgi:hypothetical protein
MRDIIVVWDDPANPKGNYQHLMNRHPDVTVDEVEEVLADHHSEATTSRSSGRPITFGRTSSGKYIAVVFVHEGGDPYILRPVTAYPSKPPKGLKHGR